MTPKQLDDITSADDYELAAARMLAAGDYWGAEYLLAYADELHEKADKDEEAVA